MRISVQATLGFAQHSQPRTLAHLSYLVRAFFGIPIGNDTEGALILYEGRS